MLQLPSAKGDRTLHFVNLNRWTREGKPAEWMLGKFWQIDREIYEEFLNLLPPIYCPGGFRLCERLTGEIAATYLQVGPYHWCAFSDLQDMNAAKMVAHIWRETTY
ncbi:hypothetical protein [Mesorhizobium sp. B2-4-5]|uniref:hypothetical protein n=1 Tax=Mesorhizobium sp. B2-4-5 TaxID=2589944 RepID=UPI0011280424|nr:hypothetical protein [Mesorhizobium sp. B2-4-5]TPL42593.1 hypothetical protein FJ961_07845 [Mesorhizobium sp. B2-4-5]